MLADHEVEHLGELRPVQVVLQVQLAGAAEAVHLVVRVVVGRKRLDAVERGVGDAVEMLDRRDPQLGVIPGVGLLDGDVRGAAQAERVRLVERRFQQIAIGAEELEAVGAVLLRPSDPGADGLRRLGRPVGAAAPVRRVDQDPRSHQRVRGAGRAPRLRLVEIRPDVADRRRAACEVQVHLVLEWLRHPSAFVLQVHVRVDDAGHHVLPGGVDNRIGGRVLGRGRADAGDQAVLDEDVGRAKRRLAVAVDHHRVADEQTLDGLRVQGRVRGRPGRLSRRQHGAAHEGDDKQDDETCERASGMSEVEHRAGPPRIC